jgi:hypothetical protein
MADLVKNENKPVTAAENVSSSELKKVLKIGISGKLNIPEDEKHFVHKKIKKAIAKILREHAAHKFIGYTAIARGADTIFANVVKTEFHQPLQIFLPFPLDAYKNDFKGTDLNEFQNLVNQCGISNIITPISPTNDDSRNEAYFQVGKYMADESDEMIFVWDEQKPGGRGGTAEIIGYFSEKRPGKKVHCITVKPKEADTLDEKFVQSYKQTDREAVRKRNRYRLVWKAAIILGWIAALLFAINTAYHPFDEELTLLVPECILVLLVLALVLRAHKRHYHRSYLDQRMRAETFRLLRSFYHAGVKLIISKQTKEKDLILADLATQSNEKVVNDKRSKWYSQYVIRSLIKEQRSYHESKIGTIGNKYTNYEGFNRSIAFAFFLNLAVYLVFAIFKYKNIHLPFPFPYELHVFLSIVLPATYAAVEGFIHFHEWAILKKYSNYAISGLKECEDLLPADPEQYSEEECHQKQSEVLNLIATLMLSDNMNWSLLLENKDSYTLIV